MADFMLSKEDFIKKGTDSGIDARVIAKWVVGLTILGFAGWFLLPILLTIAWNIVSLGIAAGALLLMYIVGMTIGKRLHYIIEFLAKITLGWLVEFDEFRLQEMQIEDAEKETENMLKEKAKVEGKYNELSASLIEKKKLQAEAMAITQNSRASQEQIEDAQGDIVRAQTYIDTIGPMVQDLQTIIQFGTDTYKIIKKRIKTAKADLQGSKDLFTSVNAGAAALGSAQRAFFGNTQLNTDADFAKQKVKEKIAFSIGQMRTSMEVLTSASNEQNLHDAAKLQVAMQTIRAINESNISDDGVIPIGTTSATFTGIKPIQKYNDFIKLPNK